MNTIPLSTPKNHERELAALRMIAEMLNSNLESDERQAWMLQGICNLLNAERGSLYILDEHDPDVAIIKSLTGDEIWSLHTSAKLTRGLVFDSIHTGQPIRCNETSSCRGFEPNIDNPQDLPLFSFLCAPLITSHMTLGAIGIYNKRNAPFDEYDQDLLVALATSIANALYNTRLIQQLKIANADLEANRWELLRSRNTLRALFDSTPTCIYIVDRRYTLIAVNLSRAQLANRKPNEMVGKTCYEILYQRTEPCPGCRVNETLFGGQITKRIERRWQSDGNPLEYEISTYPIFNEANQVVQAFLFEEDVTERRRLEATLAQSEKLAAVGQLAAGVAHEINNPLTAIIANAQMLKRKLSDNDELYEMVDLIARAGDRATQVVRNLLDFARKETYEFAPTNLNETIRKSIALIQHELVARSIDLTFEPDETIPPIPASQDHLQGVWLNMLLNAIDAMDNNHGEIRVSTQLLGKEIRVKIVDNGKGIPPERISRIFEPFYTTKEPGKGTGLGLSVCHRIVKQHGGHILVDSQVGIGTEFTVVLPIT